MLRTSKSYFLMTILLKKIRIALLFKNVICFQSSNTKFNTYQDARTEESLESSIHSSYCGILLLKKNENKREEIIPNTIYC